MQNSALLDRLEKAVGGIFALYRSLPSGALNGYILFLALSAGCSILLASLVCSVAGWWHGQFDALSSGGSFAYEPLFFYYHRGSPIVVRLIIFSTALIAVYLIRSRGLPEEPFSLARLGASSTRADVERFVFSLAVFLLCEILLFKRPFEPDLYETGNVNVDDVYMGFSYTYTRVLATWAAEIVSGIRAFLPWVFGFVLVGLSTGNGPLRKLFWDHAPGLVVVVVLGFAMNAILSAIGGALYAFVGPVQVAVQDHVPLVPIVAVLGLFAFVTAWFIPTFAGVFLASTKR